MDTEILRVLVVDDNRDAADSLALLLKYEGHAVVVAYEAPSGIRKASEVVPDLVFRDIALPGMSGYEAARRLREDARYQKTMLVALTAHGAKVDVQLAKNAGFHLHIVKPMTYGAMLEVLDAAAATRRGGTRPR